MQEKIVKVIEIQEGKVLFECNMEEIQLAYDQAAVFEEMGLDIEVLAPSAPETLAMALGSSKEDLEHLKDSIEFMKTKFNISLEE